MREKIKRIELKSSNHDIFPLSNNTNSNLESGNPRNKYSGGRQGGIAGPSTITISKKNL